MRCGAALLFALTLASGLSAAPQPATQGSRSEALPPISWTCPMHPEILEDKKGICPICKMDLVAIRLDTIWSCPVHSVIAESKPGKCPIDKRDLIQVTVAVSWTCPGSDVDSVSPGVCANGAPMVKKFTPRAHGNHNPQHGGQFFMAADNWHHLEGTYLPSGVFRMYLYDDYTKPLTTSQVRGIKAAVVIKDAATGKETSVPLVANGRTLQARIGKLPLPAAMYAHVQFKPDTPHNRFDFTFETYSKEPVAGATATMTSAAPSPGTPPASPSAPAPPASAAPASPGVADPSSANVDPALLALPIPDTVPEMLAQLRTRTDQIRAFIDRGSFAAIYVPAFQAKDLALALDEHKKELPAEKQKIAQPAIAKLVRAAYLLDAFGDIGNKQQISEAYTKFVEAAKDIQSVFPQ
jgi:hypothetical protein